MTRYIRAGVVVFSVLLMAGLFAACPSPFGYYAAGNSPIETVTTADASPALLAATPVFSATPLSGGSAAIVSGAATVTSDQAITLATATAGARIYYTTDGSAPNPYKAGTTLYDPAHPIMVAGDNTVMTVKAITFKALMLPSGVATLTMTVSYSDAATPIFRSTPLTGGTAVVVSGTPTESSDQAVGLETATAGASIYYTIDGSDPNPGSAGTTLYDPAHPIVVAGNNTVVTIKAVTIKTMMTPSSVATLTMTISYTTASTPAFDVVPGTFHNPFTVTITDSTPGTTIWYTTDGTTPLEGGGGATLSGASPIAVTVDKTMTLTAIASGGSYTTSSSASASYNLAVLAPSIDVAAGSYNSTFQATITDATSGATIWYTTDGTAPVVGGGGTTQSGTSPTVVGVGQSMNLTAIASKSGWTSSSSVSASYTLVVLTPVIDIPAGSYNSTFQATITDATSGATIWYTTDGTVPVVGGGGSTQSGVSPIAVSVNQSMTLRAVASITGWTSSSTAVAAYTLVVLPPTVTVPGGTNLGGDTGTITATTPGSVVWYTTDGSTPVPGSSPGGAASASMTLWKTSTVKAVASMPTGGWTTSTAASGTYTSGLQVYYPFNDLPGSTTTPDISGNNWTATLNGTVSNPDRNAVADSAYFFDGVSSTITQGSFSMASTTAVSVSLWVNCPVSTAGTSYFIRTNNSAIGIWQSGSQVGLAISTPSTSSASGPVSLNAWHFIVGTWDGNTISFYVDGGPTGTGSNPGTITPGGGITMGTFVSTYWQGMIDDLRIYNRVLTLPEIQALHTYVY